MENNLQALLKQSIGLDKKGNAKNGIKITFAANAVEKLLKLKIILNDDEIVFDPEDIEELKYMFDNGGPAIFEQGGPEKVDNSKSYFEELRDIFNKSESVEMDSSKFCFNNGLGLFSSILFLDQETANQAHKDINSMESLYRLTLSEISEKLNNECKKLPVY